MSSILFSKNRFGRSFKTAYIKVLVLFVQKQEQKFHCCSKIELNYQRVQGIGPLYKFSGHTVKAFLNGNTLNLNIKEILEK